ncbi:MAG: M20 aminoacylase family protein [Devosia sp.]
MKVTPPRSIADFVALRQRLHAAPELSTEEFATSALVAELLAGWGFDVATGIGGTGVVATLRQGAGARTIGLRADMDALPITEATGLPYASARPGVMHACGHDGHTTILLAAAQQLAETRDFSGTVRLIFQPAEETGGAVQMLEDGLFERFPVDALFGLHNWPGIPAGEFRFIDGPAMAAVDLVIITVNGKGGHGARPQDAVDPIVAASALVLALQSIVARNVDPLETAVLTVGSIHGGSMPTVIPDSVELQATVRTFSPAVRDIIRARIKGLAEATAVAYGATAEVYHPPGFPALHNHPDETAFARQVAVRHFGAERAGELAPLLVSEDFAFMLERQQGSYLFVGNGPSADLHSPRYDFNDAIIEPASRYWVKLVEDFLSANG